MNKMAKDILNSLKYKKIVIKRGAQININFDKGTISGNNTTVPTTATTDVPISLNTDTPAQTTVKEAAKTLRSVSDKKDEKNTK